MLHCERIVYFLNCLLLKVHCKNIFHQSKINWSIVGWYRNKHKNVLLLHSPRVANGLSSNTRSFFSRPIFFLLSSNTRSTEFGALRLTFCGATVRKVTLNPNFNHQILVNVELCLESFRPKSSLQEYLDTNLFHQHYPRVVMTHWEESRQTGQDGLG